MTPAKSNALTFVTMAVTFIAIALLGEFEPYLIPWIAGIGFLVFLLSIPGSKLLTRRYALNVRVRDGVEAIRRGDLAEAEKELVWARWSLGRAMPSLRTALPRLNEGEDANQVARSILEERRKVRVRIEKQDALLWLIAALVMMAGPLFGLVRLLLG